jgi:alpha-N-arabinofuranosidase
MRQAYNKLYWRFLNICFVWIILLTASCQDHAEKTGMNKSIVLIDNKSVKNYSRNIFGGFIEQFGDQVYGGIFDPGSPLSDENGFRKDVVAALKELKIKVVRWPGGCFASGYHWKEGVGKNRKPTPDPVWGVVESNQFGTDEFVKWCRLVGCEPYICTNAGNGTPQEMKEWVEYCNGVSGKYAGKRKENGNEKPYGIKYWSIGNENWGSHEIGVSTPEKWGPLVKESADLMLSADSALILAAAATADKKWTLPLLQNAGDRLDLVAVHNYWLGFWQKNENPDYRSCIALSEEPQKFLNGIIRMLDSSGYRGKIRIAFDEWNLRGWHHPGYPRKEATSLSDTAALRLIQKREINNIPSQYTMADALFSASFLNACLRNPEYVEMTNIAPIVNTRGPLYVYPEGIVKRTTFHTLSMYANLLQPNIADLTAISDSVCSVPVVDAIATSDSLGKNWSVALINRDPEHFTACTVKIGGRTPDGKFKATVLKGDSPDAYNDKEMPERVKPETVVYPVPKGVVMLPPHSLSIIEFSVNDSNF